MILMEDIDDHIETGVFSNFTVQYWIHEGMMSHKLLRIVITELEQGCLS